MDKLATSIENNRNLILSANSTIASIGLAKVGGKVGGILVTPAVWVLNYSAQDSTPDKTDFALYTLGFLGTVASVAAIGTGAIKAVVDDDIDTKLRTVRAGEDPKYRKFIQPCYRYGMHAPQINATTIASKGGTAWKHPIGLWVYITDVRGYLINDFMPKSAVTVYRPKIPMKKSNSGRFFWEVVK